MKLLIEKKFQKIDNEITMFVPFDKIDKIEGVSMTKTNKNKKKDWCIKIHISV